MHGFGSKKRKEELQGELIPVDSTFKKFKANIFKSNAVWEEVNHGIECGGCCWIKE